MNLMLLGLQEINPQSLRESSPDTTHGKIQSIFEQQKDVSLLWRTSNAQQRIARIKRLRHSMLTHRVALYRAFNEDLRKSPPEVDATEILPVLAEMRDVIKQVKHWMKGRSVLPTIMTMGTKSRVSYQSRGRVLIIAPWNYPLGLCFGPLVSALAAGNTVILKPSELTPAVSQVMGEIITQVFSVDEVSLFEGGETTSSILLKLPFDHIFFTGSSRVGAIVMTAAAKNLTSITLELGGKSPVVVDESADLRVAAENLMWGKFLNNGQSCIAPDFIYVHSSVTDKFISECKVALRRLYGSSLNDQKNNPNLTRIVNQFHTERIADLLQDAVILGAQVVAGGDVSLVDCYISPTLLCNVSPESRVLKEEIFGPLLPIKPYTSLGDVINEINNQPKPLALYIYSHNSENIDKVLHSTSSGGVCVNNCMVQYAHGNLPFGGVNSSGMGSAHGIYGFRTFSHERAILRATCVRSEKLFAPPYTSIRSKFIRKIGDMLTLN